MDVDADSLWVRLAGSDSLWLLDGNPHTFQGRMRAADPDDPTGRRSIRFSLSEVTDASVLARAWIAGFLAGSEPEPNDMFGPGMVDAADDDPRWNRWRSAIAEYRRTGSWPHAPWTYLLPIPAGADVPDYVWTVRGAEVWRWDGADWVLADPQPVRNFRVLVGTVCGDRGTHSTDDLSTAHMLCPDCGYVIHTLPDGMTNEQLERVQFTYMPTLLPNE